MPDTWVKFRGFPQCQTSWRRICRQDRGVEYQALLTRLDLPVKMTAPKRWRRYYRSAERHMQGWPLSLIYFPVSDSNPPQR